MNQKTYNLTDFFINKFNKKNKGELDSPLFNPLG